ncbi:MAG: hypothetical protein R3235_10405 [Altererythrobacter ishigakiensis]|nr:hypothetical protein [Altererythrobacter ishigakiensis]
MTDLFKTALIASASLGLFATPLMAEEEGKDADKTEMTEGEQELAKLLEGRVAGEPVKCIRNYPTQRLRTIDETAYVYGRGDTIYVQRTRDPETIDDSDVLVIRSFGNQLCRLDQVTTIDRYSGFFSGVVFLDNFIPYTRVKDEDDG